MTDTGSNPLSALVGKIIQGGSYDALVAPTRTPERARELLSNVIPEALLSVPIQSYPHASAMLAGLWLWHDALAESHEIAQKSPHDLHRAALSLRSEGPKASLGMHSEGSVDDDKGLKPPDPRQLRDAEESLAFWHAIM